MKKAGHFKNDIYSLKSPNENWPRLSQCDMSGTNGYEDNGSMESLIGYINHSPIPVQPQEYLFSAYAGENGETLHSGSYITFEQFHVGEGGNFDLASGTFKTTVSGVYEFAFTGNSASHDFCDIKVYKNDEVIHSMYTKRGTEEAKNLDNIANVASSWITTLKTGDTIRLKVRGGTLYSDSNVRRVLNGKLLYIL